MIERFQNWLEYEIGCGNTALQMLESVPPTHRQMPEYQKALDKLAHTLTARGFWLRRLGVQIELPDQLFPTGLSTSELGELMVRVYGPWRNWLSELHDQDLQREIEYRSTEGDRFVNRVDEILIQLHGHALYHRGQIATLVDQCGGAAVDTDYIYASRRLVSGA